MFRRAARLVVIDPTDRSVLLFQYKDAGRTWWATPGGGLEDDETFEDAARREAVEELGVHAPVLTPLWEQNVEFSFRGVPISQQERYFLLQLSRRDLDAGPVIQAAYAEEGIIAVRWWLPGEIAETSEIVFPENLSRRLLELHLSPQVASFGAPDPTRKSP